MMLGAWVVVVTALVLILPGAFVGRRMNLPWPVALAARADRAPSAAAAALEELVREMTVAGNPGAG